MKYMAIGIAWIITVLVSASCSSDSVTTDVGKNTENETLPNVSFSLQSGDKVSVISNIQIGPISNLNALLNKNQLQFTLTARQYHYSPGFPPNQGFRHELLQTPASRCQLCHYSATKDVSAELVAFYPYYIHVNHNDIKGDISVSGEVLTFTPTAPFDYGRNYLIDLKLVNPNSGKIIRRRNLLFTSEENTKVTTTHYSAGVLQDSIQTLGSVSTSNNASYQIFRDQNNSIVKYVKNAIDANGDLVGITTFVDPGEDNDWLNSDDNGVEDYVEAAYSLPRILDRVVVRNAGADKTINTVDDFILHYYEFKRDVDHNLVAILQFDDPGDNNVWFDDDDQMLLNPGYSKIQPQPNNPLSFKVSHYNAPGSDGHWFSGDDVEIAWQILMLDTNGNVVRKENYSKINGVDTLNSYLSTSFSDNMQTTSSYSKNANGELTLISFETKNFNNGQQLILLNSESPPGSTIQISSYQYLTAPNPSLLDTVTNEFFNSTKNINTTLSNNYDFNNGRNTQRTLKSTDTGQLIEEILFE